MMTDAIITSAVKDIDKNGYNKTNIPTKTIVMFYASGFINIIIDALKDPNSFDKENLYHTLLLFIPDNELI